MRALFVPTILLLLTGCGDQDYIPKEATDKAEAVCANNEGLEGIVISDLNTAAKRSSLPIFFSGTAHCNNRAQFYISTGYAEDQQ